MKETREKKWPREIMGARSTRGHFFYRGFLSRLDRRVYLGVKTCEAFLCFVATVRVRTITLTSLFSLLYVTGECHRFYTENEPDRRKRNYSATFSVK